jgi:hypothetical protein
LISLAIRLGGPYGRAPRRSDKRAQPHEHLAIAATMYRDMGMTYWMEKAEAEMTNLGR